MGRDSHTDPPVRASVASGASHSDHLQGHERSGVPHPRREAHGVGHALQSALHQVLLRHEAAERVFGARDLAEARSPRERAHSVSSRGKPSAAPRGWVLEDPDVLSVVQLLWDDRGQVSEAAATNVPLLVRYGNFLFRFRNALFPIVLVTLIVACPPEYPRGSERLDNLLDLVGIL